MASTNSSNKCILSNYGSMRQVTSRYEWTVLDFINSCETFGEYIKSPEFYYGSKGEYKWQLHLYPCGDVTSSLGAVSLNLKSLNDFKVNIRYRLYSLPKEVTPNNEVQSIDDVFGAFDEWGCENFFKRDKLLELLKTSGNKLVIFCEISSVEAVDSFDIQDKDILSEMSNNFGQLFGNESLCDVTISTGTKEFRAHKAILAARSEVFAAMFKNNMMEKENNLVEIKDINDETLEEMLRFIYTGQTKNLEKTAKTLLVAADEYAIQGLKNVCLDKLCSIVNPENAVDLLMYANLYDIELLKKKATIFIASKAKEISKTPEFKLLENTPQLLSDLFRKVAAYGNSMI